MKLGFLMDVLFSHVFKIRVYYLAVENGGSELNNKLIAIGMIVLLMIFGLCGCVEQETSVIGQWTHNDIVLGFKHAFRTLF